MSFSDLPLELFTIIFKKFGDEDLKLLGPILRVDKDCRDLVLSKEILHFADITSLFNPSPTNIYPGGYWRSIFEKCLLFENHFAIYYEAIRLIATSQDVNGSLALLQNIVPSYGDATLAYGMFQMCAGRGDIAGGVFEVFFEKFAHPLSLAMYDMGEALINTINLFEPPNEDTFGPIWAFPSCKAIDFPLCGAWHGENFYCEECYIYNCALRICEHL